jgi:hypothetical protein
VAGAAEDERERLKRGTGSEHVVEVAVPNAGVEEDELPEVGEGASAVGEAAGVTTHKLKAPDKNLKRHYEHHPSTKEHHMH